MQESSILHKTPSVILDKYKELLSTVTLSFTCAVKTHQQKDNVMKYKEYIGKRRMTVLNCFENIVGY